jgi:hypothetical protein
LLIIVAPAELLDDVPPLDGVPLWLELLDDGDPGWLLLEGLDAPLPPPEDSEPEPEPEPGELLGAAAREPDVVAVPVK